MISGQSELKKFADEAKRNHKIVHLRKALELELEHLTHSLIYASNDTTAKQIQGGCQFCIELIKILK